MQVLLAFGIRRPLQHTLRQAQQTHQMRHQPTLQMASRSAHSPSQHGVKPCTQDPDSHQHPHLSGHNDGFAHDKQGASKSVPELQDSPSLGGSGNQQAADQAGAAFGESTWAMMETFLEVRKLLEEMDVADDSTQPKVCHTHGKFRQCFGLEPRPGQLQVKGPLRVPKE